MIFCDCGKIMEVKDIHGLKMAYCLCGNKRLVNSSQDSFEENLPKQELRGSGAVEQKHDPSGFPHNCSKCGHGEAEVIELGVFYGDEAGVYLFKCKKCGWSERQSDGTGN